MTAPRGQDPVARIAADVAPEVLEVAVERAREQAATRLADLLTDAIIARALGAATEQARPAAAPPAEPEPRPTDRPSTPAPVSPGQPPASAGLALYAYAISRADLRLPDDAPTLSAGQPVELVPDGDLGLLVSRVAPDELQVDAEDLSETGRLATLARRHDAVVRAAAADGPLLPLRFGTVVADEDAARRLLREHADVAREQLARVGDAREWGVRLVRSLEAEPAPAGPASSADRPAASGTEYLSRRRQALQERERTAHDAAASADLLQEVLAPHATEALHRGGAPGSSLLLDVAYLVRPDAESGFLAAVERLTPELASHGLTVQLTGPWPPYSFASLTPGGPDGP